MRNIVFFLNKLGPFIITESRAGLFYLSVHRFLGGLGFESRRINAINCACFKKL